MTCVGCGHTNTFGARFCSGCGARLAATTPPPESDILVGSTRLGVLASDDVLFGGTRGPGTMAPHGTGSDASLPAGALFDGRYSVVRLLGRGGMGSVYEMVDTRLKQLVAVKLLHPHVAARAELVESLSREVALATRLNHPNLLAVRHFEQRDTLAYVVMELMEGDVDEQVRAKGGRLDQHEALRILDGALAGLEALHAQRIAHLDVKPQNVLLARDGTPKLADFGISSSMREQRGGGSGAGTPEYAAPEQMRGEQADVRADLYAVGVMLHLLLAGDFPFERSPAAAKAWHESGRREFPRLAAPFAPIVAKCTAVRPDDRYRSAAELRDALRGAVQTRVSAPTMTGWYPVPTATREMWASELSNEVWVDDHFETFDDPAKLVRDGAARPSWRLKLGKVVLETHPLALQSAGHPVPSGSAWLEVGRAALAGDMSGLVALGRQTPTIEARLAVAALLGGDKQEALVRLGRASKNAKSTLELLAAAEASARGLGRSDEVEALVTRAVSAATTAEDHLAVAAFTAAVRSDEAGAKTAWNAAKGKGAEGTSLLAVLQGATLASMPAGETGPVFETLRVAGKTSPSLLPEAASALGPRADVMEWADDWSGDTSTVAQLDAAAKAWTALGNEARAVVANKRWAIRQESLEERLDILAGACRSLPVPLAEIPRPLDEHTVSGLEDYVRRCLRTMLVELMLWRSVALAKELATRLAPVVWDAPTVAEVAAVKRVLALASGRLSSAEALTYARSGLANDRTSLETERVFVHVVAPTFTEETVTEQVPTGEVERYFEDEVVKPAGWFGLKKAETRQVERERPVMRSVTRVVKKPGPSQTKAELLTVFEFAQRVASGARIELLEVDAAEAGRNPRGSTPVIIKVPAGSFQMGAGSDDTEASGDEKLQHLVTLTRPFAIWSVPVTQGQYESLMKANPSKFKGPNRPVEQVSWFDAVTYCNALSKSMGLPEAYVINGTAVKWHGPANPGWRLPTEAEWEYACRAGSTSPRYGALDDVAWHSGNSGSQTHDVGGKKPNAWGLYDTLGNVWEWSSDWYGAYDGAAATDPAGPASGSHRVYRGGGWDNGARGVRAARRFNNAPVLRIGSLGFRPLRSLA